MRILLLILAAALACAALILLRRALRLREAERPDEAQDDFSLAMRRWSELEGNR